MSSQTQLIQVLQMPRLRWLHRDRVLKHPMKTLSAMSYMRCTKSWWIEAGSFHQQNFKPSSKSVSKEPSIWEPKSNFREKNGVKRLQADNNWQELVNKKQSNAKDSIYRIDSNRLPEIRKLSYKMSLKRQKPKMRRPRKPTLSLSWLSKITNLIWIISWARMRSDANYISRKTWQESRDRASNERQQSNVKRNWAKKWDSKYSQKSKRGTRLNKGAKNSKLLRKTKLLRKKWNAIWSGPANMLKVAR